MAFVQRGTGYSSVDPNDPYTLLFPRCNSELAVKRLVVLAHGHSSTDEFTGWDAGSGPATNSARLAYRLTEAGYPCLAPNLGGDVWGNNVMITRTQEAIAYAQNTLGCRSGQVHILGVSMGNLCLNWVLQHPNAIAGFVAILPVCNLQDMWTKDANGTFRAEIDIAYGGGTYNDASQGPTHNPVDYGTSLAGLPWQFWFDPSNDTIVTPSTVTTLAGQIGGSAVLGAHLTGGHSEASVGQVNSAAVIAFLDGLN